MASVIVTGYGNMLTDKDLSTPGFAMGKKKAQHNHKSFWWNGRRGLSQETTGDTVLAVFRQKMT